MYPTLNFVLFEISAYKFFTIAAFVIVIVGSYWFARKRRFKLSDTIAMLLGMSIAALIGARVLNLVVNFEHYIKDWSLLYSLDFEGFSLYGGAIFAVIAGLIIAKIRKIKLMKFADTVVPFVGIGIAIMRIGCFLNGCCFGKETNLPWGVKFPALSPAHINQFHNNILDIGSVHTVHPTQIYEMIAALIGTVIAFIIIKWNKTTGTAFLVFAIWFSAFRLFNMQLRILSYSDAILQYFYPVLYIAIIIGCGIYLFIKLKK